MIEKYRDRIVALHGTFYDYSNTVFKTLEDHIEVLCPLHGVFSLTLNTHLKSTAKYNKCKFCVHLEKIKEEDKKYDLDLSNLSFNSPTGLINDAILTNIRCKVHDLVFNQGFATYSKGYKGCPKCKSESQSNTMSSKNLNHLPKNSKLFKEKVFNLFGDKYKVVGEYKGSKEPIEISCTTHGSFFEKPFVFLSKRVGCPSCLEVEDQTSIWIEKAKVIHGDKYDYSKSSYIASREDIHIICPLHGSFFPRANTHLNGYGCKPCGTLVVQEKRKLPLAEVKERILLMFPSYSCNFTSYTNQFEKLEIECPTHGVFLKDFKSLAIGVGCPSCVSKSNPETEITTYLLDLGISTSDIIRNSRPQWMEGKELDIYIPKFKLAIEYNGSSFHHSSKSKYVDSFYSSRYKPSDYHFKKWKLCKDNDVTLLSIYDFYWFQKQKQDIYKSKIQHYLRLDTKIYARKCTIVEVPNQEAYSFYESNHIEGKGFAYKSSKSYALRYDNKNIMYATIGELYNQSSKQQEQKLHRICTLSGYTVVGGISKLSKFLTTTFGDFKFQLTLSSGGTIPDVNLSNVSLRYFWVLPGGRKYFPRNKTQKHLLEKHFKSPLLEDDTESTYMERLGYLKVYDNGIASTSIGILNG